MSNPSTETIRDIFANYPQETLADALAIVLGETNPEPPSAGARSMPEFANFAQAILYLKRHAAFPELERFTTEADLVYVQAGDRRVLLTDREADQIRGAESSRQGRDNDGAPPPGGGAGRPDFENAFENNRFSNLEI